MRRSYFRTARVGRRHLRSKLERDADDKRLLGVINGQTKRTNTDNVSGSQCLIVFNGLAVESDGIIRSQREEIIVVFSFLDTRLRSRYRRMVQQNLAGHQPRS